MESPQSSIASGHIVSSITHPLQREFHWYLANRDELVKRYRGRYLVICEETIIANYATAADAYRNTVKSHKPGTFIIKRCIPPEDERILVVRNHDIVNFG